MTLRHRRTKVTASPAEQTPEPKPLDIVRAWPRLLACSFLCICVALFLYYAGPRKKINESNTVEHVGPLFAVHELPGRGKGAVASRDIQQGELVIREKPLFIVPHQIFSSPTELISSLLYQLSQAERDSFYNLSFANFSDDISAPAQLALAIFETNAVAAGDGVGIFPQMARLNHGCSRAFNVVYSWRDEEGALVVHALKPIKKGSELLTTYFNTKRIRAERRDFLWQNYRFHCTCRVCSLPEPQSRLSDRRLIAMSELYEQLSSWGHSKIDGAQAIQLVNRIWKLGEEEGYWSERGQLAADAAQIAAAHSDASAAMEWAKLAMEWFAYELGADSRQVISITNTFHRPQSHYAWDSRKRMNVGDPSEGAGWES